MSEYVIWTVNLDKKKSRSKGRKIPRSFAAKISERRSKKKRKRK